MTVDWANEEYVRVYTRETADDLDLSWEAVALWRAMLIKFDKSGLIPARNGWLSVSRMTRIPLEVVERVGPELLKDGRIKKTNGGFLSPNFTEAQTASKSDKVRQRESRDRRRQSAMSQAVDTTQADHTNVTPGHAESHGGHSQSQNVTLASALLCDPDTSALPGSASLPVTPTASAQGNLALTRKGDESVSRERDRKTKLPTDWTPSRSEANLEAEAAATERGVKLGVELEKLRDWARSNNTKKTDWDATWRNWTRNAKTSGPQRAQSPLEQQLERVRMLEAEERTKEPEQ